LELHIIRASDFIRVGAQGLPDLEASKEKLAQLARAWQQSGIPRALLDLRQVQIGSTPAFTPVQLESLVKILQELGFSQEQRFAVLYATDPHHRARMFAFISKLHGWSVRAFGSYEEALSWLALTEEAPDKARPASPEP
jgi:hypothetical protein